VRWPKREEKINLAGEKKITQEPIEKAKKTPKADFAQTTKEEEKLSETTESFFFQNSLPSLFFLSSYS